MGLVLDWKKKLGYRKDPFQPNVLTPVSRFVVGLDEQKEKFNLFLIKNEQFGTIAGDPGTGKTTFLAWIGEQLREGYRAHAIDAKQAGKQLQLIDMLLADTSSFLSRKLGKGKPAEEKYKLLLKKLQKKRHVLLVDNAGSLGKDGAALLADILQRTQTHLLLADAKDKLSGLGIGKDTLSLKTPSYGKEDLKLLIRKRIEDAGSMGTYPFDADQVAALVKKADGNPAKLLALARDRAIELSLKTGPPPKPKKAPKAAAPADVKRIGFLNIRIERDEDDAPVETAAPEPERSAESDEEAAMLSAIVSPDDPDKIVQDLAEEFGEKKHVKKKRK